MKNRLFVNNNTIILFLFIIGSFLFIELNFRYWYRFLEQYMMFQTTGSYFQDRLAEPGGLNEYVTEFLSLAFIHPYGASVVIALLLGLISGCFFLYLTYIIHSGFISGYQNRYGDNLKPPTNVYHRMTA